MIKFLYIEWIERVPSYQKIDGHIQRKSMDKYLSTAPDVIKREIASNRYSGTDLEFLKRIQDKRTITLKQGIVLHNILSSNEVA